MFATMRSGVMGFSGPRARWQLPPGSGVIPSAPAPEYRRSSDSGTIFAVATVPPVTRPTTWPDLSSTGEPSLVGLSTVGSGRGSFVVPTGWIAWRPVAMNPRTASSARGAGSSCARVAARSSSRPSIRSTATPSALLPSTLARRTRPSAVRKATDIGCLIAEAAVRTRPSGRRTPVASPVPSQVVASTRTTLGPVSSSTSAGSSPRLSSRISQPAPAPSTSANRISGIRNRQRNLDGSGGSSDDAGVGVGAWIEVTWAVTPEGRRRGGLGSSRRPSSAIRASSITRPDPVRHRLCQTNGQRPGHRSGDPDVWSSQYCAQPVIVRPARSAAAGWSCSRPGPSSAGGGALHVVVVVRLDPRHQGAQILADGLDRVLLALLPERGELRRAGVLVGDEAGREGAVGDVAEDLLHPRLHRRVDDPRAGHVVAVLGGVGDRPALLGDTAFVDQVDDQLELVQALEVRDLGLVAGLGQHLETGLDQRGDATAEDGLLAEQVGLGLLGEGRLDAAGAEAADALGVGQRELPCLAGRVLLDRDEHRHAAT